MGLLNKPGASTKFTNIPLLEEGRVGTNDGMEIECETIKSTEVVGGFGKVCDYILKALQSLGTTFLLFDLEVVETWPSMLD